MGGLATQLVSNISTISTYNVNHFLSQHCAHCPEQMVPQLALECLQDVFSDKFQTVSINPQEADVTSTSTLQQHQVLYHCKLFQCSNFAGSQLHALPGQSQALSSKHFVFKKRLSSLGNKRHKMSNWFDEDEQLIFVVKELTIFSLKHDKELSLRRHSLAATSGGSF